MRLGKRGVEPAPEVAECRLRLLLRDVGPLDELLGVERARRSVLLDQLVHLRLGEARLVGLVVPVAPVAHEIHDDVLAELLAELEREPDDSHRGLGVVAVHVEDRRLDHLRDVRRVDAGTSRLG